jgi:hypothetical protein
MKKPNKKTKPPSAGKAVTVAATGLSQFEKHSAETLEYLRKRYDKGKGDKNALLLALSFCLSFNILPPSWVQAYTNRALKRFWIYEDDSLDKAFGVERSKDPRSVAAGRRATRLSAEVTADIWSRQDAGAPLDDELFEAVGKEYGLGKTKVKEYWKRGRAAFGNPSGPSDSRRKAK